MGIHLFTFLPIAVVGCKESGEIPGVPDNCGDFTIGKEKNQTPNTRLRANCAVEEILHTTLAIRAQITKWGRAAARRTSQSGSGW
jgi:hypothetical protein